MGCHEPGGIGRGDEPSFGDKGIHSVCVGVDTNT